ncbi:response regulator [Clostridium sp. C2-6-12]|uniref:response regulator n=1 Tax=Clostridium sp. C2-6-12 TaxID=2698832 RepID=UPI001370CEFA|nr:response regulator [Clostridium sp. C2-6-12]
MSRGKVLFVDDEENILNAIRRGLIDEDYECYFVNNGIAALEIIQNNVISVIVTDMRMPKMDGLTLLKEVKAFSPNTVRIVLSGYTQLQQVLSIINQVDVFKFITKPWNMDEEFKAVINQALDYYDLKIQSEKLKRTLQKRNAAYQDMVKEMEEKIVMTRNESNLIKMTSNIIFKQLFKILDKNIQEDKKYINYDFEKEFCDIYSENINSNVEEINVENLYDNFIRFLMKNNDQFKVVKNFKFPKECKIKTNKAIFDSFMKYVLKSIVNPNDKYNINIHGDIKYNSDKEIIQFIFDIVNLTYKQEQLNTVITEREQEKIDFINTFMSEYLKVYNGKFVIKAVESRLIIKIELIKSQLVNKEK